jgi:hypothetical protein
MRTRDEYWNLMNDVRISEIQDGYIGINGQPTY